MSITIHCVLVELRVHCGLLGCALDKRFSQEGAWLQFLGLAVYFYERMIRKLFINGTSSTLVWLRPAAAAPFLPRRDTLRWFSPSSNKTMTTSLRHRKQ